MSHSNKIRLFLIAIALIPPLVILSVIYFSGIRQVNLEQRQVADESVGKFRVFDNAFRSEIKRNAEGLAESEMIRRAAMLIKSGRSGQVDIANKPTGFDFLELLDTNLIVKASMHRGGLIGNRIHDDISYNRNRKEQYYETVEYDIEGRHAAVSLLYPVDDDILMYGGWYLNDPNLEIIGGVISARLKLYYGNDDIPDLSNPEAMIPLNLYEHNSRLYALLYGGAESGYYLIAQFDTDTSHSPLFGLLKVTMVIGLIAVVLAIVLGIYITGKSKKEMTNLIEATEKVSRGEFDTSIMAYEEGEFSQLSEAFSDMVSDLRKLQRDLATAEKIAAWKIVGQKVAHEIKNPLTPITISIDDLRRSYIENRDDFDNIFKETTATIKTEISRINKMLNEFVSFARMNPPEKKEIDFKLWIKELESLYKSDIESGKIIFNNRSNIKTIKIDPETVKQVMINLIKNGLESSDDPVVELKIYNDTDSLIIQIEDNGPGFEKDILENAFTPYQTTKKSGSGLGLAICQRIIYDHGGTIELSNKSDNGARVTITLPRE